MDEAGNYNSQQTGTRTENQTCMFSLISRCQTMRTHGHREGNITHQGLSEGGETRGGITEDGRIGEG